MIQVIVYASRPLLAEGLRMLLTGQSATCRKFEVLEALKSDPELQNTDVLVVDSDAAVTLQALVQIRRVATRAKIVLCVEEASAEFISQALSSGISGVLGKMSSTGKLRNCVDAVARGEIWIDSSLTMIFGTTRIVALTPRERQLVGALAQGLSNKEIGGKLGISEGTVKVYLSKLFQKTGAGDRFQLALLALKNLGLSPQKGVQGGTLASECAFVPSSFVVPRRADGYGGAYMTPTA
jgi:DNA-binding NarL/FixJ family response regulator